MTIGFRRGWGWLLLASLTISTIGDEITLLTLMFRTAADNSAFSVPMLLVAELLPGLIAAPYVGRLIDRRDAAKLLVIASGLQAVLIALIAWLPTPAMTIAGAGALSLLFAFSGAATFALIPVLSAALGMSLARSNSVLEVVRSLGMLAGPVAGGVLIEWSGTRNALLIDAATFVLLAAIVWASGLHRRVPSDKDQSAGTLIAEYAPLLPDRRTMVMMGALAFGVFSTAMADVAFVFLVTVSLAAGPTAFGLLTTCWAGGMIVGAAVAEQPTKAYPVAAAFLTASVMGATMLAIGVAPIGFFLVGAAFIVGGGANSVHNVAVRTMLQAETAPAMHGKVAAIYGAVTRTAAIAGYVAGGLFVPDAARLAYLVGGVLGVTAGFAGWWLYRWSDRSAGAA